MPDDFYAAGMAATPDYFGESSKKNTSSSEYFGVDDGIIVGDVFYTPGEVKERIFSLGTKMTALAKDVMQSNVNAEWNNRFKDWYDGFFKFAESVKETHQRLPLSGTIQRVQEYEKEFERFKTEFIVIHKGKIASAASVTQTMPDDSPKKKGWSAGEMLLAGIAILGVGYAGYTFAKSTLSGTTSKLGFRSGKI